MTPHQQILCIVAVCWLNPSSAQLLRSPIEDPARNGYILQSTMKPAAELTGQSYTDIHKYMQGFGWDYSEHSTLPCPSEGYAHLDGVHCEVVYDSFLGEYVFKFNNHVTPFLDRDRCGGTDRQRNEMKSQTSPRWANMNGNYDEWQVLEWKFKLPADFRPSSSFCHIHQLKAQEGANGAPLITITPRSDADGSNRRMQIIHSTEGELLDGDRGLGVMVDHVPLDDFYDEWVQVQEEAHFTRHGYYRCKIVRMRDNKVLVDYSIDDINLWRANATNIRSKYGIYRSFGGRVAMGELPQNGIKNESLYLTDFKVYEKNSVSDPQLHP